MQSLLEVLRKTEAFFADKGIENARLNAELLFAWAMGCRRLDLYLQHDRPLEEKLLEKLRPLVARRAKREPLQHLLGEVEFLGLALKVDERALIPRPETEELAEWLVEWGRGQPPARVLDLGTGSGALAVALAAHLAETAVVAVDADARALELAAENVAAHGLGDRVELRQGNWFGALKEGEPFDWIVSNPPYLTHAEWEEAAPEVKTYEPKGALVAAEEGLADLREIVAKAPGWLKPAGMLVLETGIAHHTTLEREARAAGFACFESRRDLSGRDRFAVAGLSEIQR